MKKLLLIVLCLCLLTVPVFAEEIETSGICGEDMTWTYEEGQLTIEGTGYMDDFEEDAPWAAFKDEIIRVELKGSIEYIGARAFTDYDNLSTVNFGTDLYEIGPEAFKDCDGLTVIYLPATFKVFGESSMNSCAGLSAIHCSGRPLSFRMNSMWNTFCKIYYPAEKPWGVDYIAQLEEQFKGRIEFLASDGTDHYNPEGDEEVPASVPTVAPTEVPTLPPTEAPTVPPTAAPTVAPAEPPVTAPRTEPPAPPETVPAPAPKEERESKSWIGLVIIGAVLGFVLLGTVATAVAKFRRGRYTSRRRKR